MGGGKADFAASISPEIFEDDYDECLESSSSSSSTSVTSLNSMASSKAVPRSKTFAALLESYRGIQVPSRGALEDAKRAILRHKPGYWLEKVEVLPAESYDIPSKTTILLVGPPVSGKSSLVNRITRVFDDDESAPDRAQVYDACAAEGTCFLQEYPIPKNSETLCVYDTRGLSMVPSDNNKLFERWMLEGVRHGEMDIRDGACSMVNVLYCNLSPLTLEQEFFRASDDSVTRSNMKIRATHRYPCRRRVVNYVILVANGVSILESLERKESQYIDLIVETFNSPFLAFKDDKPIVVITHGDELSIKDRAFVRGFLGEILCVPPFTQIFDIPDNLEYATQMAILNMLRFCIERADRNILPKPSYQIKMMMMYHRLQKLVEFGDVVCCRLFKKEKGTWKISITMNQLDQIVLWLTIVLCTCFLARITWLLTKRMLCY